MSSCAFLTKDFSTKQYPPSLSVGSGAKAEDCNHFNASTSMGMVLELLEPRLWDKARFSNRSTWPAKSWDHNFNSGGTIMGSGGQQLCRLIFNRKGEGRLPGSTHCHLMRVRKLSTNFIASARWGLWPSEKMCFRWYLPSNMMTFHGRAKCRKEFSTSNLAKARCTAMRSEFKT